MGRPLPREDGLARRTDSSADLASPGDFAAFEDALLRLLEHRAAIHTMGESSSLPTHEAAELLRSICFVLGIDLEGGVVPDRLLRVDLEAELRRRLADIGSRVEDAKRSWRDVCVAMPLIESIALRDTLAALGGFFKHYDPRSMAHDIPCSIDYPLCHPVDESALGIDYVGEYLRRLMIEARFLRLFEMAACERVLECAGPDHVELLVNLYEPVAIDAIGLALVGEHPARLTIGDTERQAIAARLAPLSDAGRERVLYEAAAAACDSLGVAGEDEREYLRALVPELLPRIDVALAHGHLDGVFAG